MAITFPSCSRIFAYAVLLCILIAGGIFLSRPSVRLNVIVISIDSLGTGHMSLYGYGRDTTPNIDSWSENGFVFNNYFATSYLTPVSEGSVQTGEYPFTSGVVSFTAGARGTTELLAEILHSDGYATAAFGTSPEFDPSGPLGNTFSRGFNTYSPFEGYASGTPGTPSFIGYRKSSAPITDALQWLKEEHGSGKSFYLWLPLGGVHEPYNSTSPPIYDDPSYNGYLSKIPVDTFYNVYGYIFNNKRYAVTNPNSGPPDAYGPVPIAGDFTQADANYIVNRYDDGIHATDAMLVPLFNYLKESGLANNTIVVIESEHGESLGERGYFWHYDIYDETTHVPLIIKVPGYLGTRVNALISGVDIMPTILGFLHLPAPSSIDGINYVSYLTGLSNTLPRQDVFITRTPLWEVTGDIVPALEAPDATAHYHDTAIRSTKWELIHRLARTTEEKYGWWNLLTGNSVLLPEYELYDLVNDPSEKKDVYALHQYDPGVVQLKLKLNAFDNSIVNNLPGPSTGDIQPYF